jgi:hypothetical protein
VKRNERGRKYHSTSDEENEFQNDQKMIRNTIEMENFKER